MTETPRDALAEKWSEGKYLPPHERLQRLNSFKAGWDAAVAQLGRPDIIEPHNEVRKENWDSHVYCSCGNHESVSRAEQWIHASDALRAQLAEVVRVLSDSQEAPE